MFCRESRRPRLGVFVRAKDDVGLAGRFGQFGGSGLLGEFDLLRWVGRLRWFGLFRWFSGFLRHHGLLSMQRAPTGPLNEDTEHVFPVSLKLFAGIQTPRLMILSP